jgi:ketosteroid isomerase-like protein
MSQENVGKMRATFDALNRGDLEGALADFAPEFEYIPSARLPDTDESYRGPEEFKRFLGWLSDEFDDPRMEANEFIDAGDAVGAEVR